MDVDAHIWLSTANARAMVLAMANTLATADPVNGERYRRNAEIADRRLAALRDDIARTLEPVRARPYIVFHDAYQYFEREFGTTVLGAVTLSPERPPGARTLMQVRDRLVAGQAAWRPAKRLCCCSCVFKSCDFIILNAFSVVFLMFFVEGLLETPKTHNNKRSGVAE